MIFVQFSDNLTCWTRFIQKQRDEGGLPMAFGRSKV